MHNMPTLDHPLTGMASVQSVQELERILLAAPQVHLATSHLVHGGMCARTILIPAGTVLTGAQSRIDNICIAHGDIDVTTDQGVVRVTGYCVLPAHAGFKRAGVAHADTYWTTIWPTALTDLDDIEDEFTPESGMLQTRRSGIEFAQSTAALEGGY